MAKERYEEPVVEQVPAPALAPAKYEVLISFTDDGTVYWAGKDLYPRDGCVPSEDRTAYLQSNKNRFKTPVISGR